MRKSISICAPILPGRRSEGGFTLLELMVATAISSVVLVALYMSFSSMLAARSALDSEIERQRQTTRFMDAFSKEIASAYISGSRGAAFFRGEPVAGGRPDSAIEFTALTHPLPGQGASGDLVAIRYSVAEGEGGMPALFREAWNPYAKDRGKGAEKVEVISGIKGFDLRFYNGASWAAAWDSGLENRAPAAVLAVLKTIEKGEERETRVLARTMVR